MRGVNWDPDFHPRDLRGRFRRATTGSFRVRASVNSATASYARSVPIGTKYRASAGAYIRVERTEKTQLQKMIERNTKKALRKAAESIPQRHISRKAVEFVDKRGQASIGGARVTAASGRRRAATLRVASNRGRRTTAGVRAPRRQPRTRSVQGRRVA